MDNVHLNDDQLSELVGFIDRRGFHEPEVIVDILDHFACKVEEAMTNDPTLTLNDAMQLAHDQFGALGFYPLLASYQRNTKTKYRNLYRAERNKILTDPLYVIPAAIVSVLFYFGFRWGDTHTIVWDTNVFCFIIYAALMSTQLLMMKQFRLIKRKSTIAQTIIYNDYITLMLAISLLPQCGGHHHGKALLVLSAIAAFACFYFITRYIAVFRTMKTGIKEINMVHDYLKEKGCSYLP